MWTESARRSAEAISDAKRPPRAPGTDPEPVVSGPLVPVTAESIGSAIPAAAGAGLVAIGLVRGQVDGTPLQIAALIGVVALGVLTIAWLDREYGLRLDPVQPWPDAAQQVRGLGAAARASVPTLFLPIASINFAFSDAFDWTWRTAWLTFLLGMVAIALSAAVRGRRVERRLGIRLYAQPPRDRAAWKRTPVFGIRA